VHNGIFQSCYVIGNIFRKAYAVYLGAIDDAGLYDETLQALAMLAPVRPRMEQ